MREVELMVQRFGMGCDKEPGLAGGRLGRDGGRSSPTTQRAADQCPRASGRPCGRAAQTIVHWRDARGGRAQRPGPG